MAHIICEIEDIKDAGKETTEYRELEGIVFRDEKGNERKFAINAMIPQSTSYMRTLYPDVDWDDSCIHIALLLGKEIK